MWGGWIPSLGKSWWIALPLARGGGLCRKMGEGLDRRQVNGGVLHTLGLSSGSTPTEGTAGGIPCAERVRGIHNQEPGLGYHSTSRLHHSTHFCAF